MTTASRCATHPDQPANPCATCRSETIARKDPA